MLKYSKEAKNCTSFGEITLTQKKKKKKKILIPTLKLVMKTLQMNQSIRHQRAVDFLRLWKIQQL